MGVQPLQVVIDFKSKLKKRQIKLIYKKQIESKQ